MTVLLSEKTKIEQVTLVVRDLDSMIQFYTSVLGFELISKEGQIASLSTSDSKKELLIFKEQKDAVQNHQTTGLYHIALLLPTRKDLGNMLVRLLQHQIELGAADHGYSEALYFNDPEGNGIEIYWDKPKSFWDIRPNGEIIGVTEELDGDSLVSEADGQWDGIPVGTIIGHVHLQVANLVETEKFYESIGFKRTSDFGHRAKFFAAGDYHHHIGTNTWAGNHLPIRSEKQLGLAAYMFSLGDKEQLKHLINRLVEKNIEFDEIEDQIRIKDPNGMDLVFIS
ncbi:VOC family protein [Enterococcus sp. LJL99]